MLTEKQIDKILSSIKNVVNHQFDTWLLVNASEQTLFLFNQKQLKKQYPVSTSKYGLGCEEGSYKTPTGVHTIAEKIGTDMPLNIIFKARRSTQEIAKINSIQSQHDDFITSRILWLKGEEKGINCGDKIDSYQRYIYIHGTADETSIGKPASIGCIRMLNKDVVDLFDSVDVASPVILL